MKVLHAIVFQRNAEGKMERLLGNTQALGTRTREELETKLQFGRKYDQLPGHGGLRVFHSPEMEGYHEVLITTFMENVE